MALWAVALEAMLYEEVEADTIGDAVSEAMARHEDNPSVEIIYVIDVDVMTDEDDTSLRDRLAEEEELW